MKLPSTLDFVKEMQNDIRNKIYSNGTEGQAKSLLTEHYFAEIIEALEKQTPKKPIIVKRWMEDKKIICPICEYVIGSKEVCEFSEANYCSHCGQAIDWSDEE